MDASPAYLGKLGFDRQVSPMLRVRLTGSLYSAESSPAVTLYGGDRTGSRYWGVMEDTTSLKAGTAFTNGRVNPGFSNEIAARQINPYIELGNLEVFGVMEWASGKSAKEEERREVRQLAGDVVYRLFNDQVYVGGRWNRVTGDWASQTDLTVTRRALSAGWFLTRNLLTKAGVGAAGVRRLRRHGHPQRRQVQRDRHRGRDRLLSRDTRTGGRAPGSDERRSGEPTAGSPLRVRSNQEGRERLKPPQRQRKASQTARGFNSKRTRPPSS